MHKDTSEFTLMEKPWQGKLRDLISLELHTRKVFVNMLLGYVAGFS